MTYEEESKQIVNAKQIFMLRDGGTTVYEDDAGTKYYEDYRIGSVTRGKIFDRYPGDAGATILNVTIQEIK